MIYIELTNLEKELESREQSVQQEMEQVEASKIQLEAQLVELKLQEESLSLKEIALSKKLKQYESTETEIQKELEAKQVFQFLLNISLMRVLENF